MRRLIVMLIMLSGSSLLFSQTTRYVNDGENLQTAIYSSASGDTIKVSNGTYGAIIIDRKVHVIATDPVDSVVISSSGLAVSFNFNSTGASLIGFTITATAGIGVIINYDVLVAYCKIINCGTYGVQTVNGTILNCSIENNAIGVNGQNDINPNIIGSKINNNTSWGMVNFAGYAESDSICFNGDGDDGGVDVWYGATLVGCIINNNEGYGVYGKTAFNNAKTWLMACEISGNSLTGYLHNYANADNMKVYNCLFKNNGQNGMEWKADISSQTIVFEIVNNIFTGNNGYGIYFNDLAGTTAVFNDVQVKNNIIMSNNYGVGKNANFSVTDVIFQNNNIFSNTSSNYADGLSAGNYDFSADPLFTDAANGNYTLQSGSPSINAGLNQPSTIDLDRSRNDQGIYGGSFTWSNYFNNSSGPRAAKPSLSDYAVIKGENITIQATGVVK